MTIGSSSFLTYLSTNYNITADPDGNLLYNNGNDITQNDFSVYFTHWLTSADVFGSTDFQNYVHDQLVAESVDQSTIDYLMGLLTSGTYHVDLNQNSDGDPYITELAPYIDFNAFFDGEDDTLVKTGNTTHDRWYVDTFGLPQTDNDVTVSFEINPTLDSGGNGTGTESLGHFVGSDPDDGANASFSYALTTASLVDQTNALHPDVASTVLTLNPTTGVLNANFDNLNGNDVYQGSVTITASDSYDNDSGSQSLNLWIGNNSANSFSAASDTSGDGWIIVGRGGADTLTGSSQADYIYGNASGPNNDIITGGGGADELYGGSNSDTFVYTSASDSAVGAGDKIYTFQSGTTGTHDSIDFTAFGITASDVTVTNNGTDTTILADTGGTGNDLEITLVGVALTQSQIDIHYT